MILRCLRYQARTVLPPVLALLLAFGIGGLLGVVATGRAEGLFYTYYQMYPAMSLFIVFIYGFNGTSSYSNTALSLGVTRREFFLATQTLILAQAALIAAVGIPVALAPGWMALDQVLSPLSLGALPTLAAAALVFQEMGGILGFFAGKSRWVMVATILLAALLMGVATVLLIMAGYTEQASWSGWGPWVPGGLLAGALILAGLYWLPLSKYVVR